MLFPRGIFFLAIILSITMASSALAARTRIALLPLAAVSDDLNGVDLSTTAELAVSIKKAGLELSPDEGIRAFLSANRLFDCGRLDAFSARKLGRELNCDLILTGTIIEDASRCRSNRYGILISAQAVEDGQPLWNLNEATSPLEETTLLGIGQPTSIEELKKLTLERLVTRIKELVEKPPVRPQPSGELKPYLVRDFRITPDYLQGGRPINVNLELDCLEKLPDRLTLIEGEERYQLKPGKQPGEFKTSWVSPLADGRHQLELELAWSSKAETWHENNLGTYHTSRRRPELGIELKRGLTLGETIVFNQQLLIISHTDKRQPISRWGVEVSDPDGRQIFTENYDGPIPDRLFWQGWDSKRSPLPDGAYNLALKVWDQADNLAEVSKSVTIKRSCHPLSVKTTEEKGQKMVIIDNYPGLTESALSPDWKISLFTPAGEKLRQATGHSLPATIELPADYNENFVVCELEAVDKIGNRFTLDDSKIFLAEKDVKMASQTATGSWSEDF